ncbi:MAG TPA: metal-dependent hydrolase [Phycisphaerales bacterium]|nr:metal-dependent hydrolase [Phycisphaerales bacterium]HMP36935.1 metal-dependent hydrolase [Phycisphaerales bacterium]
MDPISHAMLGAAAAGALLGRRLGRHAFAVGIVAGVLPDGDVLDKAIPNLVDPALPWEFHRHATHAAIAVPLIAAIAILPWMLSSAWRQRWKPLFAAGLVAAASHTLLDTCTSFGTHLWWPFTGERSAWDIIAIVDPMFTLPLLVAVAVACWRNSPRAAQVGLAWAIAVLSLGAVQHLRARAALEAHIAAGGEEVERIRVLPTLGNTILWRTLRETRDEQGRRIARAAAVRVPYFGAAELRDGEAIALIEPDALIWPDEETAARAARVFEVFDRFADGWLGFAGEPPTSAWANFVLADHRYSVSSDGFSPLWGIAARPGDPVAPLEWVGLMDRDRATLQRLWSEVMGRDRE